MCVVAGVALGISPLRGSTPLVSLRAPIKSHPKSLRALGTMLLFLDSLRRADQSAPISPPDDAAALCFCWTGIGEGLEEGFKFKKSDVLERP